MKFSPRQRRLFQKFLSDKNITYSEHAGAVEVQGPLFLHHSGVKAFPLDLTVLQNMALGGDIPMMPDRLVVHGDLSFSERARIRNMPQSLHVFGNMRLDLSRTTHLPQQLRVEGDLNLSGSPIEVLPDNVFVGGNLIVSGTPIVRFPPHMHVQGQIFPPPNLWDLHAFMKTQAGEISLAATSAHQKIDLYGRLAAFPDLLAIVRSLAPNRRLGIRKNDKGRYYPIIESSNAP